LAELADGLADLAGLVGVQAAGGFVHDQDVGLVQQHLRHAGALAVAFGELLDRLFDDRFQGAAGHHGVDALLQVGAGEAAGASEEFQQAERRHVGVERAVFGQIAEALGGGDPVGGHVQPGDARGAGAGREIAGKDLHGGGLTCAIGAQKGGHLALRDGESDVANGGEVSIEFAEAGGLDHWRTT
jgi:hypothetical protein